MGEITAQDKLGAAILHLVKDLKLKVNLEIGSWDGTGATRCFIDAMEDFSTKSLTCLEIDKKKFNSLVKNVGDYSWVKCYNRSSINCSKLIDFGFDRIWNSLFNPLIHFPDTEKETVKEWYTGDVDLMKKYPEGFLEEDDTIYDAVLIDGGEFTGYFEFEWDCLAYEKSVEGLDWGLSSYVEKEEEVPQHILEAMIDHRKKVRNGFAIFKRKKFI